MDLATVMESQSENFGHCYLFMFTSVTEKPDTMKRHVYMVVVCQSQVSPA